MSIDPENHQKTRQILLWMMGCSYLFAFASLYHQIPGLYGPKGLTPVRNVLPERSNMGNATYLERLKSLPSLLIFSAEIGLSVHHGMEMCCLLGTGLSLGVMSFRAMRSSVVFFVLWLLYLSVYKVGQVFLWFQWDSLLLEAGFLCILVAPLNLLFWKRPQPRSHDGMTLWLVRWLLFRLMFASGVVKLTSLCPTWWGLTALNYHYESQCLPSPFAWYCHQFPEWMQKLSVVGVYFIEIAVPLLFFVPIRSLRIFSFWSQAFLQVLIIVTGNYNFFNFLTISLCVSLVDDGFWSANQQDSSNRKPLSRRLCKAIFGPDRRIAWCGCFVIFTTVLGVFLALTVYYFNIRYEKDKILSDINFTEKSFEETLSMAVPLLAVYGVISLLVEILSAIWCSLSQLCILNKLWHLIQTIVLAAIVIVMFTISLVPFSTLSGTFYHAIPSDIRHVHDWTDTFALTNSYGLFRRMTGVGGRPELIIEGTNNIESEWMEYEFLYKPGDVYKPPTYVAPHQPRLDWQMWFAALGSYEQNPWLVHLVYKLLLGEKEVLNLMQPAPFSTPPRFIRVQRYVYHYTPYDVSAGLWNQSQKWWYREYQGEYIFPLTQENRDLIEYLKKQNFLPEPTSVCTTPYICDFLNIVREHSSSFSAVVILWSLALAGFLTSTVLYLTFS